MKISYFIFVGLFTFLNSAFLSANNISFLNDVLPDSSRGSFEISLVRGEFSESLDVLNYADKFTGSKPKEAIIEEASVSYKFKNDLKLTFSQNNSSGELTRPSIPNFLEAKATTDFTSISFPFIKGDNNTYNFELFYQETQQDPVEIDCYQSGPLVIGGSCAEADIKLLDSEIYKSTGDRVYLPVLKTTGSSEGYGFNLRIKTNTNNRLNIYHTLGFKEEEVSLSFVSPILNTTDTFLRGIRVNGVKAGDLLDGLKNDLPQETPWKERSFKYSLNLTYSLTERIALTGRASLIKVSRSNYIKNPTKKDYTNNLLLDLGFFFEPSNNILFYGKLSLSSNYLLGIESIAYNRKSNHLFDHPYGQLYIGSLIRF